jgi:PAS domain S-box-containing protein
VTMIHDDEAEGAARLRRRAEDSVRTRRIPPLAEIDAMPREALRQMIHELHVHEFELEMQNDELRRSQVELDALRARYFDLYDLAPVGYLVVSLEGRILEANLAAVTMLGTARSSLSGQPISRFIFKDDQDIYYQHRLQLHRTGLPHQCELRMVTKDGATLWVKLTAAAAHDSAVPEGPDGGEPTVTRVVLSDISARKRLEAEKAELRVQLDEARR